MPDPASTTMPALPPPSEFPGATTVWRDRTVSLERLIRLLPRWMLGTAAATLGPYLLAWGWPHLGLADVPRLLLESLGLVAVYALSVPLHEGLHAIGIRLFGGIPFRAIAFRIRWRQGIAYVHTARPMTARAYRWVLVLPTLVLVGPTLVIGLAVGGGWLVLYAWLMLASALGDAAVLGLLRGLHAQTPVRDHPSEAGCLILEPPADGTTAE